MVEADELVRKYRSIDPEYTDLIIREYPRWTLMVDEDQKFPGKMIIWLVRPGTMQRKSQLTQREHLELARVEQDAERALEKLFKPGHINYEWLGNLFHLHQGHGHEHLIPRYRHPIRYRGRNYIDSRWGRHPHQDNDEVLLPRDELHMLRDDIKNALLSR